MDDLQAYRALLFVRDNLQRQLEDVWQDMTEDQRAQVARPDGFGHVTHVSASTVRGQLKALLQKVQNRGERFIIEYRDRPVAVLVPLADLDALAED